MILIFVEWVGGFMNQFLVAMLLAWLARKAGWFDLEEYQICGAAFVVALGVTTWIGVDTPAWATIVYGPPALLTYIIRTRRMGGLGRRIV